MLKSTMNVVQDSYIEKRCRDNKTKVNMSLAYVSDACGVVGVTEDKDSSLVNKLLVKLLTQ